MSKRSSILFVLMTYWISCTIIMLISTSSRMMIRPSFAFTSSTVSVGRRKLPTTNWGMLKSAALYMSSSTTTTTTSTTTTPPTNPISLSEQQQQQHQLTRSFQFVPFGKTVADYIDNTNTNNNEKKSFVISCDGKISGTDLELSHWDGNTTPEQYYADTSTEIALKYTADDKTTNNSNGASIQTIILVNNHYDTDGVLSTYTCLYPGVAQQYSQLLIDAAEAGDFGEWTSENGIKLDLALLQLLHQQQEQQNGTDDDNAEAISYQEAYKLLPSLLEDFQNNNGTAYHYLWGNRFDNVLKSYNDFQTTGGYIEQGPAAGIVIVYEPYYLPPYTIHRLLHESNLYTTATRLLRIIKSSSDSNTNPTNYNYYYEKPGHGWVTKLQKRTVIRKVPNETKLLNELQPFGWTKGGPNGFVSIVQSNSDPRPVSEIIQHLTNLD